MKKQSKKKSILVVDDDNSIRGLVAALLTREGYQVKTANGGREALEKLDTDKFDVVVLDLMMPDVNGHDVLARLKREKSKRCVVIMSAASEVQMTNLDPDLIVASVKKPFNVDDMLQAVARCFVLSK